MKICNKDFKFEKYIEIIQDRPLGITLTKFRTSDHELNTEKGRNKAMRRNERHCQTCKTKAVESEERLLLEFNLQSSYTDIISKYNPKFRFFPYVTYNPINIKTLRRGCSQAREN